MKYRELWQHSFDRWSQATREKAVSQWAADCRADDPKFSARMLFLKNILNIKGDRYSDGGLLLISPTTDKIIVAGNWFIQNDAMHLQRLCVSPEIFNSGVKGWGTIFMRRIGSYVLTKAGIKEGMYVQAFQDNFRFYLSLGFFIDYQQDNMVFMYWDRKAIEKFLKRK